MSKTVRKFRGKPYRQGHEPCELELTRIRKDRVRRIMEQRLEGVDDVVNEAMLSHQREQRMQLSVRKALELIATKEQEEMGYGKT